MVFYQETITIPPRVYNYDSQGLQIFPLRIVRFFCTIDLALNCIDEDDSLKWGLIDTPFRGL